MACDASPAPATSRTMPRKTTDTSAVTIDAPTPMRPRSKITSPTATNQPHDRCRSGNRASGRCASNAVVAMTVLLLVPFLRTVPAALLPHIQDRQAAASPVDLSGEWRGAKTRGATRWGRSPAEPPSSAGTSAGGEAGEAIRPVGGMSQQHHGLPRRDLRDRRLHVVDRRHLRPVDAEHDVTRLDARPGCRTIGDHAAHEDAFG